MLRELAMHDDRCARGEYLLLSLEEELLELGWRGDVDGVHNVTACA